MISEEQIRNLLKTSTTGVRGRFQAIDHDIVKMLCESWLQQREALERIKHVTKTKDDYATAYIASEALGNES